MNLLCIVLLSFDSVAAYLTQLRATLVTVNAGADIKSCSDQMSSNSSSGWRRNTKVNATES